MSKEIPMFDTNIILSYCLPKESEHYRIETKKMFDIIIKKKIKCYVIKSIEDEYLKKIYEKIDNLINILRDIYKDINEMDTKKIKNQFEKVELIFANVREKFSKQNHKYYSSLELIERNFINDLKQIKNIKQDSIFIIYRKIMYQALEIQSQVQSRLSEMPFSIKNASGREFDKQFQKIIDYKSDRHHFCNCYKFCHDNKKKLLFISFDNEHFLSKKLEIEKKYNDIVITSPLYFNILFDN